MFLDDHPYYFTSHDGTRTLVVVFEGDKANWFIVKMDTQITNKNTGPIRVTNRAAFIARIEAEGWHQQEQAP